MIRAKRRLAMMLLAVAWLGLAAPIVAVAQVPPPTLTTTIHPAPANQPFEAVFHIFASPDAVAFGTTPQISVNGNTIGIQFLSGCPTGCALPPSYSAFPFTMPALPAGEYQVTFGFFTPSPPLILARLGLTVGAGTNPVAVPSTSTPWLATLGLLLALVGGWLLRTRFLRFVS